MLPTISLNFITNKIIQSSKRSHLKIMAGDFNLFFESKLDEQGGNPAIKKNSLAKFIELKESYDLRDTWGVRNTKSKRFTFAQKHFPGFI